MAETCEVVVAVSESDMSRDVFFVTTKVPKRVRATGMWNETGAGVRVFELPVEIVLHTARMTGKNGNSGLNSSLSELEQIKDMTIAIANSEHLQCLKRARQ